MIGGSDILGVPSDQESFLNESEEENITKLQVLKQNLVPPVLVCLMYCLLYTSDAADE